ncbi:MAG: hypothetical protein FWH26_01385 [Oscillospiraceae bacterium]|nr:hypothetical protein [Oscillospiraceae bacterium]
MNNILKAIGDIMAAFNIPENLGQAIIDLLAEMYSVFEKLWASVSGLFGSLFG